MIHLVISYRLLFFIFATYLFFPLIKITLYFKSITYLGEEVLMCGITVTKQNII